MSVNGHGRTHASQGITTRTGPGLWRGGLENHSTTDKVQSGVRGVIRAREAGPDGSSASRAVQFQ